jgi:competence protein ComEA
MGQRKEKLHSPQGRERKGGFMKHRGKGLFTSVLIGSLLGGAPVWGQQPAGTATPPATTPPAAATPAPKAAAPAEMKAAAAKVNINTADEAGLMSVKGIGKTHAKAIIEYRQKNGPFKTVDDLTKVKGIKAKSLDKIKDQVTIE